MEISVREVEKWANVVLPIVLVGFLWRNWLISVFLGSLRTVRRVLCRRECPSLLTHPSKMWLNPEFFFFEGFGDPAEDAVGEAIMQRATAEPEALGRDVRLGEWETAELDGKKFQRVKFEFESPAAPVLRHEAKIAVGEVLAPLGAGGDAVWEGAHVVIHCPMTGDLGLSWRKKSYAVPLVQREGIVSIVCIAPNYGKRRPPAFPKGSGMPRVTDMKGQALGIVTESVALANYARARGAASVTYAGVSFGGNMAAFASLMDKTMNGLSSTVGSDGPHAPFILGTMKSQVPIACREMADRELRKVDLAERVDSAEKSRRVMSVITARHDGYIPWSSADRLFSVMGQAPGTIASSRCITRGGHASTIMRTSLHVDSIIKCVPIRSCLADVPLLTLLSFPLSFLSLSHLIRRHHPSPLSGRWQI